jgi:methylthioribose-1-phosphate isomerase
MQSTVVNAIQWQAGEFSLLDQRILPDKVEYLLLDSVADIAQAISDMVVRGAPAIGITAAYAVVIAARDRYMADSENWKTNIEADLEMLRKARPTAINLAWAVDYMASIISNINSNPVPVLLKEAQNIHQADQDNNQKMGQFGADLIDDDSSVLTHCNAGALATGGWGTALGVIRSAFAENKLANVYADETRPWLQGERLTAWELLQDDIPVTLIADSVAATLMQKKKIQWVIVGSDRIAANGDVANKIGTYSTAVLAKHHGVKFMVVAPTSTIDMAMPAGDQIPIETRAGKEVSSFVENHRLGSVWNPVFDVTPASLVDVIVTEKGIVEQPTTEKMLALMAS